MKNGNGPPRTYGRPCDRGGVKKRPYENGKTGLNDRASRFLTCGARPAVNRWGSAFPSLGRRLITQADDDINGVFGRLFGHGVHIPAAVLVYMVDSLTEGLRCHVLFLKKEGTVASNASTPIPVLQPDPPEPE